MSGDVHDLCIVGAGMFGSAAARHASANPALRVCLIGPGEPTAEESKERQIFSSHYDEGRIVQVIEESLAISVLAKHTIGRFRELERLSGINFYNPIGFLLAGEKSGQDMINLLQTLVSHKIAFSDLSEGDAFRKRFPYLQLQGCDCLIFDDDGAGWVSARRLVEAEKRVARMQGCHLVEDVVREVQDPHEGVHQIITEKNGIVRAKRVLICAGAFTNYIRLQTVGKVKMVVNKETVAMLRLSQKEAELISNMPPMGYQKKREDLPLLLKGVYILPPIRYPDGHYYLKAGRNGVCPSEPSLEEVNEWYNSRGDLEIVSQLSCLLKQLLPNSNFEELSSKTCLTCHNETGLPYIDRITPTVTVATVGNGVGAAICDEVGRMAARLSTSGEWDSELPRSLFEAELE